MDDPNDILDDLAEGIHRHLTATTGLHRLGAVEESRSSQRLMELEIAEDGTTPTKYFIIIGRIGR